jgi:ketosteroid isomerase-like protein
MDHDSREVSSGRKGEPMRAGAIFIPVVSLLFLMMFACTPPEEEAESPPQVDVEAIKAAVEETSTRFNEVHDARDVEAMMVFYTDDAAMMPPAMVIANGKDEIGEVWTRGFETWGPVHSSTYETMDLQVCGDYAYQTIKWVISVIPPSDVEGEEDIRPVLGKTVIIWKLIEDEWKIHVQIWNYDQEY